MSWGVYEITSSEEGVHLINGIAGIDVKLFSLEIRETDDLMTQHM